MQINLYATFRQHAGVGTFQIDLPDDTPAMDIVRKVVEMYPSLAEHWFSEAGELYAHVHIFINGHEINTLEKGFYTPIQSTDTLDFLPPVAGG